MGWTKTCRPEDPPPRMLGLGYDLCFSVGEDTSLAGALIEVYLYIDVSLIISETQILYLLTALQNVKFLTDQNL